MEKKIDLSRLTDNVIDLRGVQGRVQWTGQYRGDRLIVKNARNVAILNGGLVTIDSTHEEDAVILENPFNVLFGSRDQGFLIKNGGISVWGDAVNLEISGLQIFRPHTGIRINQRGAYRNILIEKNTITEASHEGIYIGYYEPVKDQVEDLYISDNLVSYCGWDGIQIANCRHAVIAGNRMLWNGRARAPGQDFGLCINRGCQVVVEQNVIVGKVQVLADGLASFRHNQIDARSEEYGLFLRSMGGKVVVEENNLIEAVKKFHIFGDGSVLSEK